MRRAGLVGAGVVILAAVLVLVIVDGTVWDVVLPVGRGAEAKSAEMAEYPLVIRLEGGDWGYPTPFCHYPRGPGGYKMRLIFDSLLEKDEKGLVPWLAEKWEIVDGGKGYIFTIRDGVKWHDGNPLTVEDVKFSFEYFSKHPPVWNDLLINGESFIERIEILDERRVKFIVNQKNATILERLGITRIIPRHIWGKVTDPKKFKGPEAVIGCGPYILTDYSREHGTYRFEVFPDYWGPAPRVDVLEFVPVSESVLAFEKGEIDLINISPDLLSRYENKSEFKVRKNPAFWGYRLLFNMEKRPELKDRSIRQAIAYGIDKEELVEKVARGAAVPGSAGYLPIDHIWYNKSIKKYVFDVKKGRELLNGRQLAFELLTGNSKNEVRIGELLKLSLGKIGIALKVKSVDMKSRDAAVKAGDYELALIGHGGWGGDADLLREIFAQRGQMDLSPGSNGIPGYSNEKINELSQAQMVTMDPIKRKAIIYELQEVIAEEVPLIALYNTTGYIVYRPGKYDGWMYMFDHHSVTHSKLSYLER